MTRSFTRDRSLHTQHCNSPIFLLLTDLGESQLQLLSVSLIIYQSLILSDSQNVSPSFAHNRFIFIFRPNIWPRFALKWTTFQCLIVRSPKSIYIYILLQAFYIGIPLELPLILYWLSPGPIIVRPCNCDNLNIPTCVLLFSWVSLAKVSSCRPNMTGVMSLGSTGRKAAVSQKLSGCCSKYVLFIF